MGGPTSNVDGTTAQRHSGAVRDMRPEAGSAGAHALRKAAPARRAPGRDAGVTLVEIIVAVVLMGLVLVGTMSLLTTTVGASRIDRDHSNAHAWLQTASDMLYAREPEHCDETLTTPSAIENRRQEIMAEYRDTVQETENPEHWPEANIEIVDLRFWHYARNDSTNGVEEGWVADRCTTKLQLVELRVRDVSGDIIEEVEVIVGGE
jgi:type II secretory pathway pseudopilin PulG